MDNVEQHILKKYARFIAHMRAEKEDRRFGLVFGAGVSQPLGFPSWSKLVELIANHDEVDGKHVIANAGNDVPASSKTQMLFQHYRSKVLDKTGENATAKVERRIQGQWRRIIQECLYNGAPETPEKLRDSHPYIKYFIALVATSAMTVNYNFDDTIQQLMPLQEPSKGSNSVRNYETVWNAHLPSRQESAVLYHPNGFLPRNILEYPSETLVFSEDSFADQLIESMTGHHAPLLHHFSKNTCLFIGLSLQDATLRHLLRQNALINPGHYHYYIHWREKGSSRDKKAEQALRDANFEVYNLITLDLDNDELAALGRLLTKQKEDLRREAAELGVDLKYFYYLTGTVGSGKTTCLTYLGSLNTFEEWTEPRPETLGKSWKDLNDTERTDLDRWIIRQFYLKNCKLLEQQVGINVIDRPPLDPLGFTKLADVQAKATEIIKGLGPGKSGKEAQAGHIILLTGDPDDLEARVVGRNKLSKADTIAETQERLNSIFGGSNPTVINTFGLSINQVIKRVARTVLLEPYREVDLAVLLRDIEARGVSGPAR